MKDIGAREKRCFMRPQFSAVILLVEDTANDAELAQLAFCASVTFPARSFMSSDGDQLLDSIFLSSVSSSWHEIKIRKVFLLDLKLKTPNGLDVLRQLTADIRARTIPVVVFTSSERDIERIESYNLGVNSYVVKPVDAAEFMQVVGDIGHYWLNVKIKACGIDPKSVSRGTIPASYQDKPGVRRRETF